MVAAIPVYHGVLQWMSASEVKSIPGGETYFREAKRALGPMSRGEKNVLVVLIVMQSLFKGFCEAQRMAYEGLRETAALKVMLPWLIEHVADTERLMGSDFWPYGLAPNVETIDRLLRYHYEQGLSKRRFAPEEIFAPETLESFVV